MPNPSVSSNTRSALADDILDELEGEALVILEHSEQHAAITVNLARKTLKIIRSIRHEDASYSAICVSPAA